MYAWYCSGILLPSIDSTMIRMMDTIMTARIHSEKEWRAST
jgi:hypothetical protein